MANGQNYELKLAELAIIKTLVQLLSVITLNIVTKARRKVLNP